MAFLEMIVPQKFTNQSGLIEVPDIGGPPMVDFDADNIAGESGDTVTLWSSTGSMELSLTVRGTGVNSYPTLVTDALAGHAAVNFGGAHSLATTEQSPPLFAEGDPLTVVAVVYGRAATGRILSGLAVSGEGSTNYRNIRFDSGTVGIYASTPENGIASAAIPATIGQWQVIVARYSADTLSIITADGQASSPGVGGALPGLILGSSFAGTAQLDGQIARLQIYGHAINDAGCYALIASMEDFYGI